MQGLLKVAGERLGVDGQLVERIAQHFQGEFGVGARQSAEGYIEFMAELFKEGAEGWPDGGSGGAVSIEAT